MTEMLPTSINGRWTLRLPEHRAKRREWPWWEAGRLAAMCDVISRAPRAGLPFDDRHLVFDIGAEEGDFPALWASWGADVVMVEPNPRVWPNIRAIFMANKLNARVRGWFVGFAADFGRKGSWDGLRDADGERPDDQVSRVERWEYVWPRCAYGPVIGDHGFLVLPDEPSIPVTTIDALAATYGDPTVITIDVEGAELTVLRGARATLIDAKPAVFVSVHVDRPWIDEKYPGDTGEKVAEFMESFGYEGTFLATDHEEHHMWRHPEGR